MPNSLATKSKESKKKKSLWILERTFYLYFVIFVIIIDVNYLFDNILENVTVNLKWFSEMYFQVWKVIYSFQIYGNYMMVWCVHHIGLYLKTVFHKLWLSKTYKLYQTTYFLKTMAIITIISTWIAV